MRVADPAAAVVASAEVVAASSAAGRLRLVRLRPSGSFRVWALTALLAVVAAALITGYLIHQPPPPAELDLPWWLLALAFFAAELKVVDVHFRREKHSFSLSEVPVVIGFFLVAPGEFFVALLVGTGLALVVLGGRPLRVAFNLVDYAFVWSVGMLVFYVVGGTGDYTEPGPREWIAAFLATGIGAVISSLTIATAISVSGGAPQFQKLPEMIQFGGLVAVANTSLALLAVAALYLQPPLLLLLVIPLLTVFLAYRAYMSEREKHQRLELLYQSSRILQHSPELDSALAALLRHAREMFRAERAEVFLSSQDGDAEGLLTTSVQDGPETLMAPRRLESVSPLHLQVSSTRRAFLQLGNAGTMDGVRHAIVAPLLGESRLIGSMLVANRLSEGTTFDEEDLRLLETLANQAAVALENGQLEQSLSELSRLKEELRVQAFHDPLTGLANRRLFLEQVHLAIAGAGQGEIPAVLFLDLDNFKVVNDSLGHAAGDTLLVAVADRVRACLRGSDLAARLGGDEFAVLLADDQQLHRALAVAGRLLAAFCTPFAVEGQDMRIGASIGIAAATGGVGRADELMRNADVAMYTAKQSGKQRFAVFETGMHAAIVARHALSTELARGISAGQIEVHYQPVVALADGAPYGVEALARWRHPTRGLVGPDEFIPLAEESGAIIELGRAVLFESCRQAVTWHAPSGAPLSVAVNLSAAQLARDEFVAELIDILRATGLPASRLVLEMTETAMFRDTDTTISRLATLRGLGIRVAIDDFGTGYSSLGYLRRFPVDILKIAREFVAPVATGPGGLAFAHAIIALGRTLGLRIVAEGIEEPAQLAQLRALGCELGQGFLFAVPLPAEGIRDLLAAPVPQPFSPAALARPAPHIVGAA